MLVRNPGGKLWQKKMKKLKDKVSDIWASLYMKAAVAGSTPH